MDSERPYLPSNPYAAGPGPTLDEFFIPPPRPKFQHRYRIHIALFLATLLSASLIPVWEALLSGSLPVALERLSLATFVDGLRYSVPLLIILSAHEFGHYFACRYYNVDATLPFYLPLPIGISGTLGAVIRIREPFPSKRALFDIGIAGPIAGFIALLPFLYFGIRWSTVERFSLPPGTAAIMFGEPLLFKLMAWLHFGSIPKGYEVILHQTGMAAWWGMLATALNLMPFGQLDGGHISYAALGRRAGYVSLATLGAALVLLAVSLNWLLMAAMLFAMAYFLGVRHPPVPDEAIPLDWRRRLLAVFAVVMFILCFVPVPIYVATAN